MTEPAFSLEDLAGESDVLDSFYSKDTADLERLEKEQLEAKRAYQEKLRQIQKDGQHLSSTPSYEEWLSEIGATTAVDSSKDAEGIVAPMREHLRAHQHEASMISLGFANYQLHAGQGEPGEDGANAVAPVPSPGAVDRSVDNLVEKLKNLDKQELAWNELRETIDAVSSKPNEQDGVSNDGEEEGENEAVAVLRQRLDEKHASGHLSSFGGAAPGSKTRTRRSSSLTPEEEARQRKIQEHLAKKGKQAGSIFNLAFANSQLRSQEAITPVKSGSASSEAIPTPEDLGGAKDELKEILKRRRRKSETADSVTTSENIHHILDQYRSQEGINVESTPTMPNYSPPPLDTIDPEQHVESRNDATEGSDVDFETERKEVEELLARAKKQIGFIDDDDDSNSKTDTVKATDYGIVDDSPRKTFPDLPAAPPPVLDAVDKPLSGLKTLIAETSLVNEAIYQTVPAHSTLLSPNMVKPSAHIVPPDTSPPPATDTEETVELPLPSMSTHCADDAIALLARRANDYIRYKDNTSIRNEYPSILHNTAEMGDVSRQENDQRNLALRTEKLWLEEQISTIESHNDLREAKELAAYAGTADTIRSRHHGKPLKESSGDFETFLPEKYRERAERLQARGRKSFVFDQVPAIIGQNPYAKLPPEPNFSGGGLKAVKTQETGAVQFSSFKIGDGDVYSSDNSAVKAKPPPAYVPPSPPPPPPLSRNHQVSAAKPNEGSTVTSDKNTKKKSGKRRHEMKRRHHKKRKKKRSRRHRRRRDYSSDSSSSDYSSSESSSSESSSSESSYSSDGDDDLYRRRRQRHRSRKHKHKIVELYPSPRPPPIPPAAPGSNIGRGPLPLFDDFLKENQDSLVPATAPAVPASVESQRQSSLEVSLHSLERRVHGFDEIEHAKSKLERTKQDKAAISVDDIRSYRKRAVRLEREREESKRKERQQETLMLKVEALRVGIEHAKRRESVIFVQRWWRGTIRPKLRMLSELALKEKFECMVKSIGGMSKLSTAVAANVSSSAVPSMPPSLADVPALPMAPPSSSYDDGHDVHLPLPSSPPSLPNAYILDVKKQRNQTSPGLSRNRFTPSTVVDVREKLKALLYGYRVRSMVRLPKIKTLVVQIKESQRMVDDMEHDENDPFFMSLCKQLRTQKAELYECFFDDHLHLGVYLGKERGRIRRAQEKMKMKSSGASDSVVVGRRASQVRVAQLGAVTRDRMRAYGGKLAMTRKAQQERQDGGNVSLNESGNTATPVGSPQQAQAEDQEGGGDLSISGLSPAHLAHEVYEQAQPPDAWLESAFQSPALTGEDIVGRAKSLAVQIVSANNLAVASHMYKEREEARDPYAVIWMSTTRMNEEGLWKTASRQTKPQKHTLNPDFGDSFIFGMQPEAALEHTYLEIELHDNDRFNKSNFLGRARVRLSSVMEIVSTSSEHVLNLEKRTQKDNVRGTLKVRMKFMDLVISNRRDNLLPLRHSKTKKVGVTAKAKVSSHRVPGKVVVSENRNPESTETGKEDAVNEHDDKHPPVAKKRKKKISRKLDWSHVKSKTDCHLKRQPLPYQRGSRGRGGGRIHPRDVEYGWIDEPSPPPSSLRIQTDLSGEQSPRFGHVLSPMNMSRASLSPSPRSPRTKDRKLRDAIELYQFGLPSKSPLQTVRKERSNKTLQQQRQPSRLAIDDLDKLLQHLSVGDKQLIAAEENGEAGGEQSVIPRMDIAEFHKVYDDETYAQETRRLKEEYILLGGAGVGPQSP